jgi:hypothetical protein
MDRDERSGLAILAVIIAVLFVLFAVALSSQREAPEASISVPLEPDWGGRWETGVPGVKFIPLAVTPPHRVVVSFARDVESPAIAEGSLGGWAYG